MEWMFLFLSIPIGILAARIDVLVGYLWNRVQYGRLTLTGTWAEFVPSSTGRRFSLGTIKYDFFHLRYSFEGTNYRDTGEPFCHWKTVTSQLDRESGQFHYVFATTQADSLQVSSYGYGSLYLVTRNREMEPVDGYYMYAMSDHQALSVTHTMKRTSSIPESRTDNAAELLDRLFPTERRHSDLDKVD